MDPKKRQELQDHMSALLDGALGSNQQDRLGELLREHPEARDLYLAYFGLHADLALRAEPGDFARPVVPAEVGAAECEPEHSPVATAPVRRRHRLQRRVVWGALALSGVAAAVLLFLTLLWRHSAPGERFADQTPEAVDHTVAVLLQAPGAEWENTGMPARKGAPLPPGWLRLKSGFAQIEFYSGATVILQGPAELRLISRMEAYCARGKLRATVPPQAQGFTIGSPKLDLVDLGTEFGLEVDAADKTSVHVFQGRVELHEPDTSRKSGTARELTTGQSGRLDDAGVMRAIEQQPAAFPTAQEVRARSREELRLRREGWLAASAAWCRDESLVMYYPFLAEQPGTRTALDQARGRNQPHNGAIVGSSWATGRWPGKKGLEFKRVSDRVRFHVAGDFDSITLAAWVRVDALPNRNNSLMMCDSWKVGGVHWQIGDNGTVILGIKAPAKMRNAHYHALDVLTPERLGQWIHLAVVYDRDGGVVTHYVDGRPAATVPVMFDIPLRIGDAEIGNWNFGTNGGSQPVRFFSGCMDEFMLFSRPLGDNEIQEIYQKGRPPL
jgi:ferric-dicitrate binding protein FerR (iron transport regulator)